MGVTGDRDLVARPRADSDHVEGLAAGDGEAEQRQGVGVGTVDVEERALIAMGIAGRPGEGDGSRSLAVGAAVLVARVHAIGALDLGVLRVEKHLRGDDLAGIEALEKRGVFTQAHSGLASVVDDRRGTGPDAHMDPDGSGPEMAPARVA